MRGPEVKNAELCPVFSCFPAAAYSPVRLPLLSIRGHASGRPATGGSPMQITRVLLIALGLVGVCADPTWSQPFAADYPNRQVNLIVPFAPGGGTDILGRLIGQKLSERFGKSFVVENRPGAGTVTAAVQVAKSPPDGYTIMMATSGTMAMNTTLYKKLPYDPGKDLILVALVCNVPFVLVVNPALPVQLRRRSRQAREGAAAELRFGRRRRLPSPHGRVAQNHVRHPDDARALQGNPARAQ
jgi:Tripartite tricarboxylate transporter family receptor